VIRTIVHIRRRLWVYRRSLSEPVRLELEIVALNREAPDEGVIRAIVELKCAILDSAVHRSHASSRRRSGSTSTRTSCTASWPNTLALRWAARDPRGCRRDVTRFRGGGRTGVGWLESTTLSLTSGPSEVRLHHPWPSRPFLKSEARPRQRTE